MNEAQFIQTVNDKARQWGVNPLLLFSGLEGLHTFKDVPLNSINYDFLDSLILTIFALRIGDRFHSLAEENLTHGSAEVRRAAATELSEMNPMEIAASTNTYFQSFVTILNGKSTIRRYHEKAIEVAALEVERVQRGFSSQSISSIVLGLFKDEL